MKPLIYELKKDILSDKYNYFFTMLTDRFIPLNKKWQDALEKRFNKPFRPIYILPYKHNRFFKEDNYIVLNKELPKLQKKLGSNKIFDLLYPEDTNKQFSESKFIGKLIKDLIKKQGKVFILSFTNVWLDINDQNVILLGPDPIVAGKYDAKIEHYKTFKKLGLETVNWKSHKPLDDVVKGQNNYPFFISATYSSGGIESRAISSKKELLDYYYSLRPVNRSQPFIISDFIYDIAMAPNSTAIVCDDNDTRMVCINDQLLRGNKYMGNVYPSSATEKIKDMVTEMTLKVGNYLSKEGFRGLFGMDFLVTSKGKCWPVDLNPRRQGGYFCIAMASNLNIIEIELAIALNDPIPNFTYEDFQVDYAWAHSKLSPMELNVEIVKEIVSGDPNKPFTDIGSVYSAMYYPKNLILYVGNPGFYLITGTSYENVKNKLESDTGNLIKKLYVKADI